MKSLRVKLLAPFFLGTLLLTLILSWYTYKSTRDAVETSVLLISEARASEVAGSMSMIFRSLLSTVQNMAVDPHATDLLTDSDYDVDALRMLTMEWLEIYTQSSRYYRDIFIVDRQGACIASSNPGQLGENFGDRQYVQQALMGIINFGESSIGQVSKKLSTIVAGPIDTGGVVSGALVMVCELPQMIDYSDLSNTGPQAVFTSIMDSSGLLMAHRDKDLMNNPDQIYPELYRELSRVGRSGQNIEYRFADKDYIGYAMVEPISKWVVYCSGVKEDVFASAYQVGLTVFIISIMVLALIYFLVFRFANGILISLLSLIQYAQKISDGRFDQKLADTDRTDELGILHNSLQKLVENLEAMLLKSQEASKMKGEFLANMSHEIRTPLNAVIGLAHLSQRDENISPQQRRNLEQIQIAAKSLLGIINDILDISKIESGKLVLDNISFNMKEHVQHILSIHKFSADAKSLTLAFEYDPELPEWFFGDPVRIGQVLNNLLSNAIKFTVLGNVLVSVEQVSGINDQEVMMVCISIKDTGIGIARENLNRLFQPFTQADTSITRKFGGTGLGLAISDSLVHMMGGAFTVDSELGQGSIFTFTLQMRVDKTDREKQEEKDRIDSFSSLNLTGKKILIVEDNALNQMILKELIVPSQATIVTADNGQQAVDKLNDQHFDLVFMDMQMPIMDGLKATEIIRQKFRKEELPVVAVTANAMKEDVEKGLQTGMNDYITKPIEPDNLATILNKWIYSSEKFAEGSGSDSAQPR